MKISEQEFSGFEIPQEGGTKFSSFSHNLIFLIILKLLGRRVESQGDICHLDERISV